ncbi:MAG TPA: hypothetical protein VGG89_15300 [Candidatus Baltobacteraceae bacterium]|jgi:hypothetical protein
MSHFGNVPADVLVGTVEKLVSKMDEAELAAAFSHELSTMPPEAAAAFVEAMFDAFRDRGESSEDAAEGAGTTIASIQARDGVATQAFVEYARQNPGLMKEATIVFVERHPDLAGALPAVLRSAIAERLTNVT